MANKEAESSYLKKIEVHSNYGKVEKLHGGTTSLQIFESVLDPTIRATANVIDAGYRNKNDTSSGLEVDDLNLTAGEKTLITVEDNYGSTLDLELRIREVSNVVENTKSTGYVVDLYSVEAINNEFVENRVVKRYEGKISDYVEDIIVNNLKTEKDILIDPCINSFNFLGHVQKPFYILTWLAARTAPDIAPLGDLAGYFFWETTNGYNFKSIDKIFKDRNIVKKLIYTETPYTPEGYDASILNYSWSKNISLDKKLLTSAFNNSTLTTFNPFTNRYNQDNFDSSKQFEYENIGGLEKPLVATDLNLAEKATRIADKIFDFGTLPPGSNLKTQLEKSKDYLNFDADKILRQSFVRYNNLFSHRLNIKIAGDFSIHAGDLLWCDFPETSSKSKQIISKKKSGIYMVIDVSHYITPRGTFTGLNLARESIVRSPS